MGHRKTRLELKGPFVVPAAPYDAGMAARHAHARRSSNPYAPGTRHHQAWWLGFDDADAGVQAAIRAAAAQSLAAVKQELGR